MKSYVFVAFVSVLAAALVCGALGGGAVRAQPEEDEDAREEFAELLVVFETLVGDLVPAGKARAQVDGGTPVEIELGAERVDGRVVVVWELELLGENGLEEVLVDARSGEVLAREREDAADAPAFFRELRRLDVVPLAKVLATISDAVSGAVLAVELEVEDGNPVWEARLLHRGGMHEVELDGRTGRILPESLDEWEDEDDD